MAGKKYASIKEELHDFKRARILDVASQLFFEAGYSVTTMDQIAQRLNITKPFIYYHFKNKADVLAGVCGRTTAFAAQLAEMAASAEGPAQQRLYDLVHAMALRVIEGRVYLSVYFREEKHLPESAHRELAENRRRFDRALGRLLSDGVAEGVFEAPRISIASHSITGMATWLFNWYRPNGPLPAEEIAAETARLAVAMVRNGARVEEIGPSGVTS